jgi:hypothetical protein
MVKKYIQFETQLGESAIVLTDKAHASLEKKSEKSGISTDILEEVYCRGYRCWTEAFGGTPEQFAFDRVNSFIANGFAAQLDEDLMSEKRGLWDNIWAKRKRIAAGSGERMRKPGSKGAPSAADLKNSQTEAVLDKPTPTVSQIAKKFDKPAKLIAKSVKQGSEVEKEHTKNTKAAKEIARDHLGERPDYYKKLSKMEKSSVKEEKKQLELGTPERTEFLKNATPGQTIRRVVKEVIEEDKKGHYSPSGGMTKKGVLAYRRKNPGSKLQTAVTTKPSKLKAGSKAANRRKSFCARMGGVDGPMKDEKGRPTRKALALRKWNCEERQNDE